MTKPLLLPRAVSCACAFALLLASAAAGEFRPPAVPLVTSNPFLSIWSESDHLNGATTKHWTHREHSLVSLIRVDGKTYRLMGLEPKSAPPLEQKSVEVLPTRSIYDFEGAGVHVTMTFMQPALPDDLDVYSWPLSYITWLVQSADGNEHQVQLYDSTSSQLAVNNMTERVEWSRSSTQDLTLLRVGTRSQPVLGSCGDDHRINWGYAYAAALKRLSKAAIGAAAALEGKFVEDGTLPAADDANMPRAVADDQPVMAFAFDLGSVGKRAVQRQIIVAYDEVFAIKYYGQKLLPYWARNGAKIADVLQKASSEYPRLLARCKEFDRELMEDLTKAGGEKYAKISALAYRECVAANGLAADANKQPLFFTKENTSNGDIATVDVFFPMDPIWIVLSPSLAKASLVHVLMYSASHHWKFPNAPHDLGTYPLVFGRDDGGEGMPVEESGNMLILCDAIAHADGNADFVAPWWPQLTQWANYLEKYGLDPENQLCTDDFMGHLAHNANLSIKAILGLAAYGDLCRMRGEAEAADKYFALARADAKHWMKVAAESDHYRLAFDKPRTWSQKYNLVWDRILGLNVFPPSVAQAEVAHYKKVMLRYGVPLDSRTHLTKTDWSIWSATLAENQADFEAIVAPIYDYLNATTARDPIADSYVTDRIRSGGMHARPVVGGFFIKLLTDGAVWKKWASRDKLKPANWAPLPEAPRLKVLVPLQQNWRYTTQKPGQNWTKPDFDALRWKEGRAGFGTDPPGFARNTEWTTDDIWLRRTMTVPEGEHPNLLFVAFHDEDVEIYVNGILAAEESGFTTRYVPLEISREARVEMKPGAKIVVAVHCHQTVGGQGIDVGLAETVAARSASRNSGPRSTPTSLLPAPAAVPRGDANLTAVAASHTNSFYLTNRAPLAPSRLLTLPIGAVRPQGWLRVCLQRQRDGLSGHLGEISAWLQKKNNAWLSPNGKGEFGWEEVPYWLRGYIQLAYLLDDPSRPGDAREQALTSKMIAESRVWIEGALRSQRADGDFGPDQRFANGARDYWANMLMLYSLQTYYEHSGDARVIELMTRYFKYQLSVPDDRFLVDYWQHMRGGDNLYMVQWLYNITGDGDLLKLADKVHRRTANWDQHSTLPNWHNVNIAEAFREPATWFRQSKDPDDLQASYDVFNNVRKLYGQVPGGMFGADENARPGYSDPRQAIETCGMVEEMLSDELMLCFTADAFWGDHCEDVAFNTYPAALMPDFRSLRYLTAPNMAVSDSKNHAPGLGNGGPFLLMNPFSSRCCQHNHSQGWPYFAKHLWMATPDNGLCAAIYSASEVSAKVGDGTLATISEDTHYPFEETLRFTVKLEKPTEFPLYFRIPGWCAAATLAVNGKPSGAAVPRGGFARIDRRWQNGDTVALELPMQISVRTWEKNSNSVSVDYGPLTFSLKIGEKLHRVDSDKTAIGDSHWQKGADPALWPSWEILPTSPWNYGLELDSRDPAASFKMERRPWRASDFPFTLEEVPLMLTAKARRIPQWTLDRYGLVATLPESPVVSDQPEETVTLVPMGAVRLRISAFPTIGDSTAAQRSVGAIIKELGPVPRAEHPRPDAFRENWMSLNGQWQFEIDRKGDGDARGLKSGKDLNSSIIVPFCPESRLSGLGLGNSDYFTHVWYRRKLELPAAMKGKRVLLHFGGVDYKTWAYVNGQLAGTHRGGSAAFDFEITSLLMDGANELVVHAFDDLRSGLQPGGKQAYNKSEGCVYTRTTGIWQPVWLEAVGSSFVESFSVVPDPDHNRVMITAAINGSDPDLRLVAEAFAEGRRVGGDESAGAGHDHSLVLNLSEKKLWEPGSPFLYDLKFTLYSGQRKIDELGSYFGLRKIAVDGRRILINGKPIFQRLILDQGFYPDGVWTAPSDEALRHDIEMSMAAGFNGARLHQKVFEPRYLYWADKLGYLVWGEFPNWGYNYAAAGYAPFAEEWTEVLLRDRNHPAIVGWCPFNETGASAGELQQLIWHLTKAVDPTRPALEASGWAHTLPHPEVCDTHDYEGNPAKLRKRWMDYFAAEAPGSGRVRRAGAGAPACGSGVPFMISEIGGIGWDVEGGWGYGGAPKSMEEFYARYQGTLDALLDNPNLFGFCYTQLTDVEQEHNGLYYYNRKPKFDVQRLRAITSRAAAYEKTK